MQHAKIQEFIDLRQGKTTVSEYVSRFTELSCFVKTMVVGERKKATKLMRGLNEHKETSCWNEAENLSICG